MSVEQKDSLISLGTWGFRIVITVLGFTLTTIFLRVENDIKDLRGDIKNISNEFQGFKEKTSLDVSGLRERLIRIETKIEKQ